MGWLTNMLRMQATCCVVKTHKTRVLDVSYPTGNVKALPPMMESRLLHATTAAGPFVFAFGGRIGQNEI